MSENNYGALMMKSAVGASDDINAIVQPGIYIIPPSNTSSPDATGGVLTVHSGTPIRRTFTSYAVICLTSTRNGSTWSAWKGPLSRTNPFADIKADGTAAIAEALSNLGLGTAAKRAVGDGANQIPDMGFFQAIIATGNTLLKFPFIDQYGNARTIMVQLVTIQTTGGTDKGYPLPYAFPNAGLFATGNRATSGYNAAMNVRIANATTVSIQNWGNAGALEDCCVIAVGW
ncbi:pyocin knob domain-containing protein [Citrobacter braakii]|uniref:pyocin knob domain-containing protein n=1 Tax=Citrobacter braakii TaxID=57706 RepID=UPI00190575E2|nr:pyocin knob domain-containing protein [Citrobacter braakii]MBJ8954457.1 hypothetical protein [Citrobacter braakii]